jgi:AmiR/NasT family two-component response regulator
MTLTDPRSTLDRSSAGRAETSQDTSGIVRRRVLFAQDHDLVTSQLAHQLDEAGVDIVGHAGGVAQATRMVADLRPDATVLDISNGVQAAAALHDQRLGPVVMLADKPAPALIQGAAAAGVMAVVLQPFTKERLLPAIELAVARHADTEALRAELVEIRDRLEARKVIERAKGLLMTRRRITEPEAFRFLQQAAMKQRSSIRDIAQLVVDQLSAA